MKRLDTTMKHTFFIKADFTFVDLLEDIAQFAKEFTGLRFARHTLHGYKFFRKNQSKEQVLNKIVQKSQEKYPQFSTAMLVDVISELVNTTVKDDIKNHGMQLSPKLDEKGKSYGNVRLIEAKQSHQFVPRYPWFMPLDNVSGNQWQAQDLSNSKILTVMKTKNGKFYEYEIEQDKFLQTYS